MTEKTVLLLIVAMLCITALVCTGHDDFVLYMLFGLLIAWWIF